MNKKKTSSGCNNEDVVGSLHDVSAEDGEREEEGITNEGELDSQPAVKSTDIDDGGLLSI